MTSRYLSEEAAKRLVNSDPRDVKGLNVKEVRKQAESMLLEIEEKLKFANDLTCLEMRVRCNDYHEAKESLNDLGEPYGQLSSYIERQGESVRARFYLLTPTKYQPRRVAINPARKTGYSPAQLRKVAGEYEGEMAAMTEEHYARLRLQAVKIREMLKKIRAMKTFPTK